jgi:hypothetical protein
MALLYKNMPSPFKGNEDLFSGPLQDFESAKNMVLSLDRGMDMPISKNDDPTYMIKRLVGRTRKADFFTLDPIVHQLYDKKITEYEQLEAFQLQADKEAQSELIPTGGVLAKCDFYVTVPTSNGGTTSRRAEIPMDSIKWLMDRIEKQGFTQSQLNMLQEKQKMEINSMSNMGQQNPNNFNGPQA